MAPAQRRRQAQTPWRNARQSGTVASVLRPLLRSTASARWARTGYSYGFGFGLMCSSACKDDPPPPTAHDPVELSATDQATVGKFVGSWAHRGGDGDREAAMAAIDAATESMNSMIRGVARSRIRDSVHLDATLSIAEADGIVTITRSELPRPFVAPANGREFETQDDEGETAKGQLRIEGDTLVSRVETDQGGGERTHRIEADGSLVIHTRIFSPRLPSEIEYDTHYARP